MTLRLGINRKMMIGKGEGTVQLAGAEVKLKGGRESGQGLEVRVCREV